MPLNTYGHKVSESVAAWAGWARKLLAERETAPIETGNVRRGFRSLADLAAAQVEESRRERLIT